VGLKRFEMTPTMERAAAHAAKCGGELVRWPGGFWIGAGIRFEDRREVYGSSTVAALVSRGLGDYVEWKEHGGGFGRFPVRVRVTL
jgi:hypothetical protein